jgi:hypothetical protein
LSTGVWRMRAYWRGAEHFIVGAGGKTKEKGRKAARWHPFHADACSDATPRCAAAKLLPFAAPLLGARNKMNRDDKAAK